MPSAGWRLTALHLQPFAQEEGVLLGVTTQEELQHDTGVLGAARPQDAASVVHADLPRGRGAGGGSRTPPWLRGALGIPREEGHPASGGVGGRSPQGKGAQERKAVKSLLLLLSRFSRVQLCATPYTAAYQAPPSLGFCRQEHWSGLPFPPPMHESIAALHCEPVSPQGTQEREEYLLSSSHQTADTP